MIEYISLKALSEELGLDRSNTRKYVIKHGFSTLNIRTSDSRNQQTLAVTATDAEAIRELRRNQGFGARPQPIDSGCGYWYVIQLIPELAPNRIKLGFATDVMARLAAHRTAAPTAQLVKSWPCKQNWESVTIESVVRIGCTHLSNEVYECDNVTELLNRADAFFAVMPSLE